MLEVKVKNINKFALRGCDLSKLWDDQTTGEVVKIG